MRFILDSKFYGPKSFLTRIFLEPEFFLPTFFLTTIFMDQTFFVPKIFWANYFGSNQNWIEPKNFGNLNPSRISVHGKPSFVLNPSNTELSTISLYSDTCCRYPTPTNATDTPRGFKTA